LPIRFSRVSPLMGKLMHSAMSKTNDWQNQSAEGKAAAGCLFYILLLGIAIFIGIRVVPLYYSYTSFETDVKTEVSHAGAHSFDDETVIKDLLDLARRNEINLTSDNVKIDRSAGQVRITIRYSVPVDFIVCRRTLNFEIKASSFAAV